jgi:hypothetical protein
MRVGVQGGVPHCGRSRWASTIRDRNPAAPPVLPSLFRQSGRGKSGPRAARATLVSSAPPLRPESQPCRATAPRAQHRSRLGGAMSRPRASWPTMISTTRSSIIESLLLIWTASEAGDGPARLNSCQFDARGLIDARNHPWQSVLNAGTCRPEYANRKVNLTPWTDLEPKCGPGPVDRPDPWD